MRDIQLNSVLKEELKVLYELLPKSLFLDKESIKVSIKNPNWLYREVKVFVDGACISEGLTEEVLKKFKDVLVVCKFNYFSHYHENFKNKFYSIILNTSGKEILSVFGEDSME